MRIPGIPDELSGRESLLRYLNSLGNRRIERRHAAGSKEPDLIAESAGTRALKEINFLGDSGIAPEFLNARVINIDAEVEQYVTDNIQTTVITTECVSDNVSSLPCEGLPIATKLEEPSSIDSHFAKIGNVTDHPLSESLTGLSSIGPNDDFSRPELPENITITSDFDYNGYENNACTGDLVLENIPEEVDPEELIIDPSSFEEYSGQIITSNVDKTTDYKVDPPRQIFASRSILCSTGEVFHRSPVKVNSTLMSTRFYGTLDNSLEPDPECAVLRDPEITTQVDF